jgi:hypothetical protein
MNIAKIQAVYFALTGIWPIISIKSFEAVTGPKVDKWLVITFSWLVIAVGLQLWFAKDIKDVAILGIGSALALGAADAYYSVIKRRISYVYLAESAVELLIILGWIIS